MENMNEEQGETTLAAESLVCGIKHMENMNEEQGETTLAAESLTEDAVDKHNEINKQSYRSEADSWTEDDSSSTISLGSSSDCSDSFLHKMQKNVNAPVPNKVTSLKTKGELDLDELPPIEHLNINVNESEIEKVGIVHAIVNTLVIVHTLKNLQPLDIDSVLFLTPQKPLGRIFDVFGPVSEPFYIVRFNSSKHIEEADVKLDIDVFYAPKKEEITTYVFVDELKKQKGSDASWRDNNEPPEEYIDYSDDEQEKAAKQKRKAKNRPKPFDDETQSNKRDQPLSTSWKDRQQPHPNTSAVNSFRSMHSNMSNLNTSNYLSRDNMSPDFRSNYSRQQNRFQGPPMYASQPRNSFAGNPQSHVSHFQHDADPQTNLPHNRPHEASFLSQPFTSRSQRSFTSGPQTSYYSSSHSTSQYHPSTMPQPTRGPPMYMQQQQAPQSKSITFPQSHMFGQMSPLGPMSPALQQPGGHFPPTVMSPPPFVPISAPPTSPNFSYFSHKFASSSSPPTHGHVLPNVSWFQGQSTNIPPRMRYATPMSPLSIQIPTNLRTQPPTAPSGYNAVSPVQPPQNVGHFALHPSTHQY